MDEDQLGFPSGCCAEVISVNVRNFSKEISIDNEMDREALESLLSTRLLKRPDSKVGNQTENLQVTEIIFPVEESWDSRPICFGK